MGGRTYGKTGNALGSNVKSPLSVRDSQVEKSIERFNNMAFNYNKNCTNNESQDVNFLEKLLREERATFQKKQAVL